MIKITIFKSIVILNFAAIAFATLALPCFADQTIPIRGFHITQERLANNGVLVSRPVQLDQNIVTIVTQNRIRSIEDYAAWLDRTMTYQAEGKMQDQWLTPQEFLKAKRGDCEDFAFLNSLVLRVLGYKPHVVTLKSSRNAHAICAFEYRGKFYWFDNAKLKTSSASDLIAFAQEVTDEYNYSSSSELDPSSKKSNLLYQRS